VLYAPPFLQIQSLFYGDGREPVAQIVPDTKYPDVLWRIRWPDGRLSAASNLARAKDAAMAIVERGPPRRDARLLRWKRARESLSAPRGRVLHPAPIPPYLDARSQPKFSKTDRAWRAVAGPAAAEINLRIPLDAATAVGQMRARAAVEDHLRKLKRRASRAVVREIPLLDPDPPPAALSPIAPPPFDDPFEIPAFLDRTRFAELELEEAA
jgi:hypothetical protein